MPAASILELKRTPLYDIHRSLGARLVGFSGWEMPVQYSGVIEEHTRVRASAGLFDVSHMGEIECAGPDALEYVQLVTSNDIERISDNRCQYTLLCNPNGGVVDDVIVYRLDDSRFIFCTNASNTGKVFDWLRAQETSGVVIEDVSAQYAQLALQGPASKEILRSAGFSGAAGLKHFHFTWVEFAGTRALVSRTGYTGEDGFEIYLDPKAAAEAWEALMSAGQEKTILPVGLGARDTLRLEMGYPLYGHELDEETTPLEAGLAGFVRLDKAGFIGRDALVKQSVAGVKKKLVGFKVTGRGIPREGYEICIAGSVAGRVTSGTLSPTLKVGIGMGYVDCGLDNGPGILKDGDELDIMIRGRAVKARVTKAPFYARTTECGTA